MKSQFKFPLTETCIVVWYRNGIKHETNILTPATDRGLRDTMIRHKVGFSEIRCVKADPNGVLQSVQEINPAALRLAMMAC
jgi:hypothetical protein